MTIPDFDGMFDRHARAVYNHAFRLTGSWSTAEDVTQAVFLTAWRRRTEIRLVDGSPLPWLLVTATHQARTEQRALTRWRNRLTRAPAEETIADPADDVAGRLDDEQRMRTVLAAVHHLPRAEREAVALCLWSGIPYPEAAAVLGVTESTVRSRVSRARARLARRLSPGPATPSPPPEAPSPPLPTAAPRSRSSPDSAGPPSASASRAASTTSTSPPRSSPASTTPSPRADPASAAPTPRAASPSAVAGPVVRVFLQEES